MSQEPKDAEIPTFLTNPKDMPRDLQKYFNQRYITAEKVAIHQANRAKCRVIVDGFCGAGGNIIQFAKTCEKVIAIDIDPIKLQCARNNAAIYNVSNIEFILGDTFEVLPTLQNVDVIFMSPPWGGPQYSLSQQVNIENIPIDLFKLFEISKSKTDNIILFMPKNMNQQQMIDLANGDRVEVEETYLNDRIKAIAFYYGNKFL